MMFLYQDGALPPATHVYMQKEILELPYQGRRHLHFTWTVYYSIEYNLCWTNEFSVSAGRRRIADHIESIIPVCWFIFVSCSIPEMWLSVGNPSINSRDIDCMNCSTLRYPLRALICICFLFFRFFRYWQNHVNFAQYEHLSFTHIYLFR